MAIKRGLSLVLLLLLVSLNLYSESMTNCNQLAKEKSPYLKQHAQNPVCWYAWGEEAFAAAKKQNKPIFLSIGYSTCYWCHVMEKDSFEQQEVADVLNEKFIAIKVDREERPDIDEIYMDAVHAMKGRGGWPLSMFLTPELKPFWGGTFFYKKQFIEILRRLSDAFHQQPEDIKRTTDAIYKALENDLSETLSLQIDPQIYSDIIELAKNRFDSVNGGFSEAPKFPPSLQLDLLLSLYTENPDSELKEIIEKTLNSMAEGGLYDHLAGGFHRYCVDATWTVPHFEKMLYDNAQLISVYLEAYKVFNNEAYKHVTVETMDYLIQEMQNPDGGFYAALDAGEVDKEGEYYVWKYEEAEKILTEEELETLTELFDFTKDGNFEQTNVLDLKTAKLADKYKNFAAAQKKLKSLRDKRERPHLDNKIITSWNALTISAFVKAYQLLEDKKYLEIARSAANFILSKAYKKQKLYRRIVDTEAAHAATLEDYAFLISALIDLYQADFNPKWLEVAVELQELQDKYFYDQKLHTYYSTEAPEAIIRKIDYLDNVIPSGNSVSLGNLLKLNTFFASSNRAEKVDFAFATAATKVNNYPFAYPISIKNLKLYQTGLKGIAIIEPKGESLLSEFTKFLWQQKANNFVVSIAEEKSAFPDLVKKKIAIKDKESYYICQDHVCKLPTNDIEKAKKLIKKN